jgi:protein-disulfide isomerase
MVYLAFAVALVGALCVLDLLLTVGVIRRLREVTEQLAAAPGLATMLPRPAPGFAVADFSTVTEDGEPLTRADLPPRTLVGFFSPTCAPCKELLPDFLDHAAQSPGGRALTLAVVIGTPAEAAPLARQLAPVARVVVEHPDGALSAAFSTAAYPTLLLLDAEHTVAASGGSLTSLLRPVPAAR